jgi:hypothetical protein
MPSEIREKPQPTPHPDYPRQPGAPLGAGQRPAEDPQRTEEFDPEESVYDSVIDHLNLQLGPPSPEPDSALETDRPFAHGASFPFLEPTHNKPGTAEFFGAVGSRSDEIAPPRPGWGARIFSHVGGLLARPHPGSSRTTDDDDDDGDHDTRGALVSLLLLSYASAVTLGLVWMLWTGRAFRSVTPDGKPAPGIADDRPTKAAESVIREELPAFPAENVTSLGQSIRVGEVEVTPLSVQFAAVDLVSSTDPGEFHHDERNSLVLRVRLTNLSSEQSLKPFARSLVRDNASALDRSFIATPGGGRIDLYPLAVESEWLILGQEFPVLKPGESDETLVASEPISEDRLPEVMTWRVRLRIGPYRTDMLGVRCTKNELSQ